MAIENAIEVEESVEENEAVENEEENEADDTEEQSVEEKQEKQGKPEKRHTMVPHAALHESRQLNKELRAELIREREERTAMERRTQERLEQLTKLFQGGDYQDETHESNEVKELKTKIETWERQGTEAQQQQLKDSQFVSKYQASMEAYVQDNPEMNPQDPNGAYRFLFDHRTRELAATGLSGAELVEAVRNDERAIVERAWNDGKSPGEVLYEIAKMRGYKRNNQASKIDNLDKGLKASKSLGSTGSSPDMDIFDMKNISELPDKEFNALWSKYEKKYRRNG